MEKITFTKTSLSFSVRQTVNSLRELVMYFRDSDGHVALFCRCGHEDGYFVYRGIYLGVSAKIAWCHQKCRWELSVINRGVSMVLFHAAGISGTVPPSSTQAWYSRHSDCNIVQAKTVFNFLVSKSSFKPA